MSEITHKPICFGHSHLLGQLTYGPNKIPTLVLAAVDPESRPDAITIAGQRPLLALRDALNAVFPPEENGHG